MSAVRRDPGKPAAALAIIASIFATGLIINVIPTASRDASIPITSRDLPSRALLAWTPDPPLAFAVTPSTPPFNGRGLIAMRLPRRNATLDGAPAVETLREISLTLDRDPGEAPLLDATTVLPLALPRDAVLERPAVGDPGSPLVMPFAKTSSALRMAFSKTGSAIKAAASGTAGVFGSHP